MGLPVFMTRKYGRTVLKLKKDSPHIFFVAGVVGSVVSTVMACRATLKLSETLDEIQNDFDVVKANKENAKSDIIVEYSDMDHRRDVAYVYVKSGIRLSRLYGPSVIVGAASITALTGSHVQLTRRNAAVMAAYAAVQKAYDDYRERVREQIGEDGELDLYRSAKNETIKDENGKNEKVKVVDPNTYSPYAKMFDEYSPNWEKDPELNRLFIQCQQNYANNLLVARGHLFLNEVYDMLGVERTKPGAVVGWVISDDGDNYVDFGIFEARNSLFVNGKERSIMLDFNVDGVIWDKI